MSRKYKFRKIFSALIGSIGVLCAGSTYFWVNPVQHFLQSDKSPVKMTKNEVSWFVSVVEFGDLAGTLPSGYLADKFGRKTVLLLAGPLLAVTWLIILYIKSFEAYILARILQGLAVGCIFSVTPTYLGEISERRVRGMAGTLVQTMWYIGTLYQYIAGSQLDFVLGIYVVCIAPALIFSIMLCYCPETPRYYLLKKDVQNAARTLDWLYGESASKLQLEGLLNSEERLENVQPRFQKVFQQIFTTKKPFKSLCLVSMVAITNVIGVAPVLSYSTETFKSNTGLDAKLFTIIMGILSLISALVAATFIDRLGRRPLLLLSTVLCTLILFIGGIIHHYQNQSIISALCIAFFPPIMSLGPGTLTYALMAELFSDRHRGVGVALINLNAAIATFLGLKFFSVINDTFGLQANFFILSSVTTVSAILIYKFIPETKGKTFQEIQELL